MSPQPGGIAEKLLLDEQVLEEIRELEGFGEPGLLQTCVSGFERMLRTDLPALRDAIAARDCGAVVRLAHRLRSSADNLGAYRLAALLRQLESAARHEGVNGLGDWTPLLDDAARHTLDRLSQWGGAHA